MEVKPGYKQTETGIIPEDWRIQSIEQISTVGRGRVISHREIARSLNPRYPVYSSQTSDNGVMGYLDTFEFEGEYITWTTDGANAGTVFARNGRFNCTNVCGTIKLKSDNPLFVAKVLGKIAPRHVSRHLGNPKLMNDVMKRIKIPLPPTKAEQEAIAEALSDADALIESLEQLLSKKCELKQGAMQELLTGKKRLTGFSGKWEVRRLGSVLKFQVGFPFSSVFFNEKGQGIRLVKNRDLKSDDQVFCYSGNFGQEFLVRNGDVLAGMDGDFLPCLWAKGPALLNQRVGRSVVLAGLDILLAFYYLLAPLQETENVTSCTTVKHLSHRDIEGIEKPLPTILEQTAIAAILSDMDAEIAALEAKLAKARDLKQGMMQELLTGRIRLV